MIGRTNVGGGGGGKPEVIFAFLTVNYETGATCLCTDTSTGTVLKSRDTSGYALFKIPYAGLWTVSVTSGETTVSERLSITRENYVYSLTIEAIPSEYQRVEYLEAVGNAGIVVQTQSEFTVDENNPLIIKAMVKHGVDKPWAGIRYYDYSTAYVFAAHYITKLTTNVWAYRAANNGGNTPIRSSIEADPEKTYEIESRLAPSRAKTVLKLKDVQTWEDEKTWGYKPKTNQIGLFRPIGIPINPDGTRMHYAKIYIGSTMLADLVPVYRKEDLVPGFYDILNKKFLTKDAESTSTSTFIVGPAV